MSTLFAAVFSSIGLIIFVALVFDYINGFHDAANSIATVVSTKVLTPRQAVLLAACAVVAVHRDHLWNRQLSSLSPVAQSEIALDGALRANEPGAGGTVLKFQ